MSYLAPSKTTHHPIVNKWHTMTPKALQYSTWKSTDAANERVIYNAGIKSNWDYRRFMQKNANSIMQYNTYKTFNDSGTNPHTIINNGATQTQPLMFSSLFDTTKSPSFINDSDLKQQYIKKTQMSARMVAPSISASKF